VAAKLARFSWIPGGLTAALVIAVARLSAAFTAAPLELGLYDRVLGTMATLPAQDIAIITIDDASIEKLGEWPWPRDVHARLLDRLRAAGSRIVAFTVPFDTSRRMSELERLRAALALLESSNLGNSDQAQQLRRLLGTSNAGRDPDTHLASAMSAHGDVILPVELRLGEHAEHPVGLPTRFFPEADAPTIRTAPSAAITQLPGAVFANLASAVGHNHVHADVDGQVRSDLAAVRVSSVLLPSLATVIAARASGLTPHELNFSDDSLRTVNRSIPLDEKMRLRPHYFPASGPRSFKQYPYWEVLEGVLPASQLRDKIVLVGITSTRAAAADPVTPTARSSVATSPPVMAIANAVSSVLSGTVYSRPTGVIVLEWIATLGVIAFAAFMLPAVGAAIAVLASILIVAVLIVTEVGLLGAMHVWAKLMIPCLATLAGLSVYLISDMIRRANADNDSKSDAANSPGNLRTLGQTFQRQGQLDLAFETYRRCPLDAPTMELLYHLGLDFERRAQRQKAAAVYSYIASRDPDYRDLKNRRARVKDEPLTRAPMTRAATAGMSAPMRHDSPESLDQPFEPYVPYSSQRTLGRYQIERELGKGAMGTVYLGRDPHINRVVAIKAIPLAEEFEEDKLIEARERFFREAEMAGRLNHPAIVTVYDAGEDQGLAYIAMEYLRGQHLSHFTDAQRLLPYPRIMHLVARVADALHYAHRQNVIHRDIKPANIMFDPDTDELKITDFGIARLTDTSRTKTGIVLGTPSFMSPEQLEGRTIDGRSDQFSLGVSLYQLLCGQLPFRAESMPRLMHKIATEPHTSARLLRPELPACVDEIFDRVLSKDADQRYANCAELAAALRACAGAEREAPRSAVAHEWLIP
jgi:serine/threonine-protein kinase